MDGERILIEIVPAPVQAIDGEEKSSDRWMGAEDRERIVGAARQHGAPGSVDRADEVLEGSYEEHAWRDGRGLSGTNGRIGPE
jgi:hypothetical protein